MEKETTVNKFCCDCVYYIHGQLENPCEKGCRYVGYLRQGCHRGKANKNDHTTEATKVCCICGKELPVSEFRLSRLTKDRFTEACKECYPKWKALKSKKLAQSV